MALPNETIKTILLKDGVVDEAGWQQIEKESKRSGLTVQRLLVAEGRLSHKYLNELIGAYLHVPLFDIRSMQVKSESVETLPEAVSRQRQVLVIGHDAKTKAFHVAMLDPTDMDNLNFLKEYLKGDIEPYLATSEDLRLGYRLYKKKASENFENLISEQVQALRSSLVQGGGNVLENVPLAQFFDTIVDYGAILDASDIYFQPEEEIMKVRFRIDGVLRDILIVDKSINDGVVAKVKTMAGLRIDEHMRPQDGRFRVHSSDVELDVRAAVMPTFFGEKVSLRLLPGMQSFLTFDELGMEPNIVDKLQRAIKRPFGMLLSSGPTGSGKTTTIYGVLSLLNRPEVHITTVEDPVEYLIRNVSQTQVNLQADITFASGLRALLRHSPDIIFIGEIRDRETADIAVN
ncbi:MAG: ATPase, T2SS/T4P/T4SS family, partial [Patescibacteria group bacterium]